MLLTPKNVIMWVMIPEDAKTIIEKLAAAGFESYVVGGCVRDMIMGRTPADWDITTSARPEDVKKIFRRTIDTGIEHGTVTVMFGKTGYEVTTYRTDGKYADHRHPTEVIFAPTLEEDLKRRDFTINAMAYNPTEGIIDLYGGKADIESGTIRCVGDPMERFEEDALRMLRGIRFAGQLGFDIEKNTLDAITAKASTIEYVSAERIQVEISKLITSGGADKLRLAYETGLSEYFLPELNKMMEAEQNTPHHMYTVGEHSLRVILHSGRIYADFRKNLHVAGKTADKYAMQLAYAALLHDSAKPLCKTTDEKGADHFHGHDKIGSELAKKVLRRLKLDNDTINTVTTLVLYHDRRYDFAADADGNYAGTGKKAMRKLIGAVGKETMPLLFVLQEADILAQSEYMREQKLKVLEAGKKCYDEIIADGDAIKISDLAITGSDLIKEKGFEPGPAIGEELKRLLDLVIEEPSLNTKESLMKL